MKKLSYVVWDTEIPSNSCTLFVSILLPNGISLKTTSGYIALIVVLWDEYETNLHFMFVWTAEWKITWKLPKFIVRNRPFTLFPLLTVSTIASPEESSSSRPSPFTGGKGCSSDTRRVRSWCGRRSSHPQTGPPGWTYWSVVRRVTLQPWGAWWTRSRASLRTGTQVQMQDLTLSVPNRPVY